MSDQTQGGMPAGQSIPQQKWCLGAPLSWHEPVAKLQRITFGANLLASILVIIPLAIGYYIGGGVASFLFAVPLTLLCGLQAQRGKIQWLNQLFCCCTGVWIVGTAIAAIVILGFVKPITVCVCDPTCTSLPNMPQGPRDGAGTNLTELRDTEQFIHICASEDSYLATYNAFGAFSIIVAIVMVVVCCTATQVVCCKGTMPFDMGPRAAGVDFSAVPVGIPVMYYPNTNPGGGGQVTGPAPQAYPVGMQGVQMQQYPSPYAPGYGGGGITAAGGITGPSQPGTYMSTQPAYSQAVYMAPGGITGPSGHYSGGGGGYGGGGGGGAYPPSTGYTYAQPPAAAGAAPKSV